MPSNEELKTARMQEREDGWGIIYGVPEDELLESDTPVSEQTLLESGQKLTHHGKEACSGNCCLHGSSNHGSCRMPRQWRYDKGIIEHVCPHGVGHPCYAGVDYAMMMGQYVDAVHGCDGCCVEVDNDPFSLNEQDGYTLLFQAGQIEALTEHLNWAQGDINQLRDAIRGYQFVSLLSALAVMLFVALSVIYDL